MPNRLVVSDRDTPFLLISFNAMQFCFAPDVYLSFLFTTYPSHTRSFYSLPIVIPVCIICQQRPLNFIVIIWGDNYLFDILLFSFYQVHTPFERR